MAKNPVCPIYYNDLINSTKDWSDEEFGAYLRLLLHQWDKGSIPEEMSRILRIAESAKRNWKLLSKKFLKSDEGLKNPIMEGHRESREKFTKRQQENVLKRYQSNYQNGYQTSTKQDTREIPLEDENENKEEKGGMGEKEGFFLDQKPMDTVLTTVEINAVKEFIQITANKKLSDMDVTNHWIAFKLDNFKKHDWYGSHEKLLSHFRHSLKNELNKKKKSEPVDSSAPPLKNVSSAN